MPKIERNAPAVTTNPKAPAVARATPAIEPATPAPGQPMTAYTGQAAPVKELVPRQRQLTTSADPSALWGEAPAPTPLDPGAFAALPPAEQRQALAAAQAERDELGQRITERLERLDAKWNRSRLVTRTEALREYQEHGRRLHPGRARELDALLDRSEAAQRRINELRARIERLPKTAEQKAAMKALRTELARELVALRAEQSTVVKAATAVVDAEGLKVDRLAVTEQLIDPSAPPPGSGGSLLDLIDRFFAVDGFLALAQAQQASFSEALDRRAEEREREVSARRERQRVDEKHLEGKRQQAREELARVEAPEVPRVRALLAKVTPRGTLPARPA